MALEPWQETFLKVLAKAGTVEKAAEAAGVHRVTAQRRRKSDREFAELWEHALESGTDLLEEMAIRRAMEHSDHLLLALLKARRPAQYQDRQRLEHVRVDYQGAQAELEQLARRVLEEDKDEEQQKALAHDEDR